MPSGSFGFVTIEIISCFVWSYRPRAAGRSNGNTARRSRRYTQLSCRPKPRPMFPAPGAPALSMSPSLASRATSEASFTDADGEKRLIEYRVEMEPADGYIRIEELMKRELAGFEHFFVRIVEVLTDLDFAPTPVEKGSQKTPA